jgi:hypothetical protein
LLQSRQFTGALQSLTAGGTNRESNLIVFCAAEGGHMDDVREIHLICDRPPGRDMPTLIEVEDEQGRSIDAGEWRERPDGYWELVLHAAPG